MFITKLDRSRAKMKREFQNMKLDPKDFGELNTKEKMDQAFENYCKLERKRLFPNNLETNSDEESTQIQNNEENATQREGLRSSHAPPLNLTNSGNFLKPETSNVPPIMLGQTSTHRRESLNPMGYVHSLRSSSNANHGLSSANLSFSSRIQNDSSRQLVMELGSSPELMKEFGIDPGMLRRACSSIGNPKKALRHILNNMKEKIRKDLQDFYSKRETRENDEGYQELIRAYNQIKSRTETSRKDIFDWMKVPTKMTLLKKKFRAKIVENIGDGKNYAKIREALEAKKKENEGDPPLSSARKSKRESFSSTSAIAGKLGNGSSATTNAGDGIYQKNTKLFLDNISFDNTQILDEFSKFMKNTKLMTRRNNVAGSGTKIKRSGSVSCIVNWSFDAQGSPKASFRETPGGDKTQNTPCESPSTKEELSEKKIYRLNYQPETIEDVDKLNLNQMLKGEGKWDFEKEKEFVSRRQKARFQMTYLCDSSSWNDVAFGRLINEIRYNDSKKNYRNNLISKYMGGEWLTEAEIRYIAVTSECINKFVDREYFNKALEILDEEVFDNIEMNLAENIIKEYKAIRQLVYDSRNKFLQRLNRKKFQKILEKSRNQELAQKPLTERQIKLNRSAHEKMTKKFRKYFEKKEEKEKKKQEEEAKRREEREYFKISIVSNEESPSKQEEVKEIPKDRESRKEWREFLERNFQPKIETHLFGVMPKKDYKHINHPHSKIILGKNHTQAVHVVKKDQDEQVEKPKNYNDKEFEEMSFYRLKKREIATLNKEKLKKTYSCGPVEVMHKSNVNGANSQVSISRMKAAAVIQNAFKCLLARKKAKAMKVKKEEQRLRQEQSESKSMRTSSLGKMQRGMTWRQQNQNQISNFRLNSRLETNTPNTKTAIQLQGGFSRAMSQSHLMEKRVTIIEVPKEESEQKEITIGLPQRLRRNVELSSLLKNRQLMQAVKDNHINKVKGLTFLYSEEDINTQDPQEKSLLYYAAGNGNLEVCQWLLNKKAKVNQICTQGNTPMHAAFRSQNPFVVMLLCKHGGSLDVINNEGFTPVGYGSQKLLSFLSLEKCIALVKKHKNSNPEENDEQVTNKINAKISADVKNNELIQSKIIGKGIESGKLIRTHKKNLSLQLNNEI